jgi:hypothetical protein
METGAQSCEEVSALALASPAVVRQKTQEFILTINILTAPLSCSNNLELFSIYTFFSGGSYGSQPRAHS